MKKTILSKHGYIIPKDIFADQIKDIKKELTVEPFQVFQVLRKQKIKFPVYQENEDYLFLPKYYGLTKFGLPNKNKENNGKNININFKGELREKQQNILKIVIPHLTEKDGGVLVLPCAAGKTVFSLYLACHFKVKTLVIVHKTFLLNQWKERAEQFTDAKIGIIQQDKVEIDNKDIVIGMLQSIAKEKYDDNIFKDFGLVIFDEAHHAPSKYFSKALPLIACKKTIGLSATPKRSDKMEKVLYWFFGDIMYKANVEENDKVLVNIYKYDCDDNDFREYLMRTGEINRAKTINKLVELEPRNNFIINLIKEVSEEEDRKILILSDRLEHLDLLKEKLEGIKTDYYVGGMKQKALKEAETAQVIFASYGMAAEGLDIPDLNTLFMVTPRKEVEQSVGRILRKINPNIRPTIYDITDQLSSFIRQGSGRKRLYNKMGFEINTFEVLNDDILNQIEEPIIINNNNNDNNIYYDFID